MNTYLVCRLLPTRQLRQALFLLAAFFYVCAVLPAQAGSTTHSAIGGGNNSTCARTPVGGVKCWGDNSFGQLGDGTNINRITPVDVVGLGSGVAAITVGGAHACAITNSGGVKCWGLNVSGQLGDGTAASSRNTPVDIVGLATGVINISAGDAHTCAVTDAGAAKCWGYNGYGQLGIGNTINSSVPLNVIGFGSGATVIAAGVFHSCLISDHATPYCWGLNSQGQLGDNTTVNHYVPAAVAGIGNAVSLALGDAHSCARLALGGIRCWGDNGYGQLGDNTTVTRLTPVDIVGLTSGTVDVAAGESFTCARTVASTVKCWGANYSGQLGDGSLVNRLTPVGIQGSANVAGITVGRGYACALTSTNYQCWGANSTGNLGNGTTSNSSIPVTVIGSGFTEIFPTQINHGRPTGWITSPGFAAGWIVAGDTTTSGLLSLRSEPTRDSQASCTEFTAAMLVGSLTFQRRVSSELSDGFKVYIDGALEPQSVASGNLPWTQVTIPVKTGTHTVRFCYQKGFFFSRYADSAWIDNVLYPIAQNAPPGAMLGKSSIAAVDDDEESN
jgi:alpha-tubulin suppressor-like RCC1 family protein